MNGELKDHEKRAVLSASEKGDIRIPPGTAMEIEAFLRLLLRLEKLGIVSRTMGKAFYRPFTLTNDGWALHSALLEEKAKTRV